MKINLSPKRSESLLDFLSNPCQELRNSKWGISIELKKLSPRQTDEQRGYYWVSLHGWGKSKGLSAHETEAHLHPAVCAECWGVRSLEFKNGHNLPIPRETSANQTREAYSELIETLGRMAAEWDGYVIPAPIRAACENQDR